MKGIVRATRELKVRNQEGIHIIPARTLGRVLGDEPDNGYRVVFAVNYRLVIAYVGNDSVEFESGVYQSS